MNDDAWAMSEWKPMLLPKWVNRIACFFLNGHFYMRDTGRCVFCDKEK